MRRLVLFDIDGTILHGGKLFRECFEAAMRARHPGAVFPRISFSGKTDKLICRELMKGAGLPVDGPEASAGIESVISDYLACVRKGLASGGGGVRLLPGADAVVRELHAHADVELALLTGNVREGARLKLGAVGLESFFEFDASGAFGDDHWDRYQLPAVAVKRAHERLGRHFHGKDVIIIGDTIHDVKCGESLGVRTIGVGTGQAEQRQLVMDARPDHFFEDLGDVRAVVRAVLEG
jgi:phosphoglycolate phosphatase